MSAVSVSLCQSCSIRRMLFSCGKKEDDNEEEKPTKKKKKVKKGSKIVLERERSLSDASNELSEMDVIEEMAIVDAPKAYVDITPENMHESDFYVFNNKLQFLVCEGPHIQRFGLRVSHSYILGKMPKDCDDAGIVEHYTDLITQLCEETLRGSYLQMQGYWEKKTFLIKTYPIFDERNSVVAAMMVIQQTHRLIPELVKYKLKQNNPSFMMGGDRHIKLSDTVLNEGEEDKIN